MNFYNESVFHKLFEQSLVGYWDWDILTGDLYISPNFKLLLGYDINEIENNLESFKKIIFDEDFSSIQELYKKHTESKGKSPFYDEIRFHHKDESVVWAIYTGEIAKTDENGNPTKMAGFFIDITKQKKIESELRQNIELLSKFIEHSPIYAFIKEVYPDKSIVIQASENYKDMIGVPGSKMIGKTMQELFPQEFAAKITADDWEVVKNGQVLKLDEDLNERNYTTIKFPITLGQKKLMAGYTIDITERKKYEETIANFQKLESLGILAGGIAHDFNNLLGGILGYIDLALQISTEEEVRNYLSRALLSTDRAKGLTNQLLTFAKGGDPVKKLNPLFPFIKETAQFALSGSKITCEYEVADNLWLCEFDDIQIAQIVDNIIINAKQAMPEGGKITISALNEEILNDNHPVLSSGKYVKISIADNGVGMPSGILSKIFNPFFTTKVNGHGLGLATTYSIVKKHGGYIEADSEVGKGSIFTFYLPASFKSMNVFESEKTKEKENIKINRNQRIGTILIMDDEIVIREVTAKIIKSLGYNVICTSNGEEALNAFKLDLGKNREIHALLLDLTIQGGLGGKDIIDEIRKVNQSIPVIVTSGYADDPIIANPQKYGFTASISKPFGRNELDELFKNHID